MINSRPTPDLSKVYNKDNTDCKMIACQSQDAVAESAPVVHINNVLSGDIQDVSEHVMLNKEAIAASGISAGVILAIAAAICFGYYFLKARRDSFMVRAAREAARSHATAVQAGLPLANFAPQPQMAPVHHITPTQFIPPQGFPALPPPQAPPQPQQPYALPYTYKP